MNEAKDKVVEYLNSMKQRTSDTLDKVLSTSFNGSEYTRNLEEKAKDFIGNALANVKNTFGSSTNAGTPSG